MAFKKVGVSQDSKLIGDSLRIQNESNVFAYGEFVYTGSSTYSYVLPGTSGTSGDSLFIQSGSQLEWKNGIGATGPRGATGAAGSSGSSGRNGSSGSSGSSGTAGTSGTSATYTGMIPGSVTLGLGLVTFVTFPQLAFSMNQRVLITQDPTNYESGKVVTYDVNTGVMTVDVDTLFGSGSYTNMMINLDSGQSGANGSSGSSGTSGVGSSGSSGVSGTSGTSGSSGSTGSSGSSGANGVGGATMLGTVNFVARYSGATALGTASIESVGDQIRFRDGSISVPSISFANDGDTGIYRVSANRIAIAAGGATSAVIDDSQFAFKNGSQAFPGFVVIGDSNTGLNSPSADRLAIITGGANAAIFGSTNSVGNQTFFNKAVNHTPVTNGSVSGTYTMDMSSSNVFILTLTASTTLDYSNAQVGSYVVVVSQNATGGYALSLTSGKFIGVTAISIGSAANSKSILQVIYDGSSAIISSQRNLIAL